MVGLSLPDHLFWVHFASPGSGKGLLLEILDRPGLRYSQLQSSGRGRVVPQTEVLQGP